MGFNQFAGEIGEQIAKRVTSMKPALSSGGRLHRAGQDALLMARRNGLTMSGNTALGYGAMGTGAGGVVYGANKLRRKSKPSY